MLRRIPVTSRPKSPHTQRVGTRTRRAPLALTTEKSRQPLALSKPENRSDPNLPITNGSNKHRNNADYINTSEKAAERAQDMKSAPHGNDVSVRKARQEPLEKPAADRPLRISARPKQLLIAAPAKDARCSSVQFEDTLKAEANMVAHLSTLAPKMENQTAFDYTRFYTEANTFFAMVQAYRRKTGDTSIHGTPPTAKQVAACEAELKDNDKEYRKYAYYLNHRHNKAGTMNRNMKSDFVEYGVLSDLIPKNRRPSAEEVYSAQFISGVKGQFKKEGANVITTAETFLRYTYKSGFHGRTVPSPDFLHGDGEMFNTENEAVREIHRIAGSNQTGKAFADAAQKVLGLKPLKGQILLHIWIPPQAINNERIPSGKENGANEFWLMGATTPYGHLEIITDRVNMAGIPGTDPNHTAPIVRILGEHGVGVSVYPGNYQDIGEHLIAISAMLAQKGSPDFL